MYIVVRTEQKTVSSFYFFSTRSSRIKLSTTQIMMMFKSIIVLALLMASFVATNANDTMYGNLQGLMDTEEGRELVRDDFKKKKLSTKIHGNVIRPSDYYRELCLRAIGM